MPKKNKPKPQVHCEDCINNIACNFEINEKGNCPLFEYYNEEKEEKGNWLYEGFKKTL